METLVKRNGLVPVMNTSLFPSVNTFFDDFISRDLFDWTDKNFTAMGSNLPSVNLKETDDKLQVELAAPGMKKEDFKVEIDNNMLMISSEKKEEKEETRKKDNYVRKEFSYQSFFRSFTLPDSIDENKIEASYKDGILHVDIAKKDNGKKKLLKKIAIK
ncbi:Hsp20/alpha crystallin family protein [Flavobacterium petrolei]|jgi:HSP20 family protein|uniref:Hsp20/alpha crystallin family protein n=1 Tax=Flavobacterium petrolei TaxID=2259594 RepID=A0A482TS85_9FLAO|nr:MULTISPECIES: Hsp20/alpha crystallin family protein [Flavobacterium]MDD2675097.1 Hsp20/alpha crystallin family protein [Flavobacterium sp.]QIH40085.1 Hsp20/alpha crystallin family protein [Flavobacterium sp. Sr18]RYJ51184.1 Hsp20/alpha crystallin family protein [Flavobacterium petrolei]